MSSIQESGNFYMNLNNVLILNGTNFRAWKSSLEHYLMMHENMDLCFTDDQPEPLTEESTAEDRKEARAWYRANRMAKNVMRNTMSDTVRGSIEEPELAIDYMEAIERKFKESEKAEAARLSKAFHDLRYNGTGGVREHLLKLININARLRELLMGVNDDQVVHVALHSLPSSFSGLRTSYNSQKGTWTVDELISICVDEEERMKKEKEPATAINLVEKPKWKKNKLKATKTITKPSGNTAAKANKPFKFKCYFCKKIGHMKKDCSGFKAWLVKKGIHKEEEAKK